jgi:hypothetical protein
MWRKATLAGKGLGSFALDGGPDVDGQAYDKDEYAKDDWGSGFHGHSPQWPTATLWGKVSGFVGAVCEIIGRFGV